MVGLAEIVAATSAGCATTIVGHPLDTIKVHLQTNATLRGDTWNATRTLYTEKALFRGIGPPLANAILMNTVMFSVFTQVKQSLSDNNDGENESMINSLLAGTLSGLATACISTPTDLIKIQAQIRGFGSWDVLQQTGFSIKTLFRGHIANLCREGVFTMAYLGLYDQIPTNGNLWQVALASSFTGGIAWVVSYPFDTVKSIVQGESSMLHQSKNTKKGAVTVSYTKVIQQVWQQGGISSFFRGCGASTGRAMLVTSLRMIVYEWVMSLSR